MSKRKQRKSAYIPPAHEIVNKRQRATTTRTIRRSRTATGAGPDGAVKGPRGRTLEPPSWRRVARRAPIYYLLFFALQYITVTKDASGHVLSSSERFQGAGVLAALMTLAFVPMMLLMERWQYSRWVKRQQRTDDGSSGRSRT